MSARLSTVVLSILIAYAGPANADDVADCKSGMIE